VISRKILYVEDDEDIRSAVGQALSWEGFEVTAVSTAEEAIHSLEETTFQVMLTDYRLPGENAPWLLREGTSRGYLDKTPVIVLSAERAPTGIEGYTFLRKPIDLDVLSAALAHALADQVRTSDVSIANVPEKLVLTLYVTTRSHVSQKAIRNLHRVLKQFDESTIQLVIIDVGHLAGQAGALQSMEDDRIVVTPTLVVRMRGPKVWIAGDLSDDELVAGVVARGIAGHASDAA
jgi:DNA-binding NtrC family response regulator